MNKNIEFLNANGFRFIYEYVPMFNRYQNPDGIHGDMTDVATVHYNRVLANPKTLRTIMVVDTDCNRVIGFANLQFQPNSGSYAWICCLTDIYVIPEYQNQGIGAALLQHLITTAKEEGYERFFWMARDNNIIAQKLFDKVADRKSHIYYEVPIISST